MRLTFGIWIRQHESRNRRRRPSQVLVYRVLPNFAEGDEIAWYSNKTLHRSKLHSDDPPNTLDCPNMKNLSPNLRYAVVQKLDNIELWDLKLDKQFKLPKSQANSYENSAFSTDGEQLVLFSYSNQTLFQASNGKLVKDLKTSNWLVDSYVLLASFSDDAKHLLTAGNDGAFSIRRMDHPNHLARFDTTGYRFVVKPLQDATEGSSNRYLLQILRNRSLLRSQAIKVDGDKLHLTARRESERLFVQFNDEPPIEFNDIFALSSENTTHFGVMSSQSDQLVTVRARKRTQSASLSPLESADLLFSASDYEGALASYAKYTAKNSETKTVQESLFKQALCYFELDREAEADEILTNLVTQNGDLWPPMAACKLWLYRLRQNKQAEAEELLEFLTSRFRFEELVNMIPEEARREIIGQYRDVTVGTKLFMPNPNRVRQAERSLAAHKLLMGFGGEMHMVRAYHMSGQIDQALQFAEPFVLPTSDQTFVAENVVGVIQEYLWLLQLKKEEARALDLIAELTTPALQSRFPNSETYLGADKVRLLYILGRKDEAEKLALKLMQEGRTVSSPDSKASVISRYNAPLIQCLLGIMREERGDVEGAKAVWSESLVDGWDTSSLNLDFFYLHIVASKSNQISLEQSQKILLRILQSTGDVERWSNQRES